MRDWGESDDFDPHKVAQEQREQQDRLDREYRAAVRVLTALGYDYDGHDWKLTRGVQGEAAPRTDHIRSVPGGAAFLRVAGNAGVALPLEGRKE